MTRLARDRGANVAAMMAVAMIPLAALAGSALDVSRMYVVKSRLQQACDAGVLAGRRFMATDGGTTLDATATAQAKTFFTNNFGAGYFGAANARFTPSKTSDQQVAGTATVQVPMTVMKMFSMATADLTVTCKARFDIADTDIVFVLDTTGSMACRPEDTDTQCNNYVSANSARAYTRPGSDPDAMPGYLNSTGYAVPETTAGNGSRIKALRQAVKDFAAVIASSVDSSTRVRYGFVTYTSTINAGKAIYQVAPSYLVGGAANDKWDYQTRWITDEYVASWSGTANGKSSANCGTVMGNRAPLTAPAFASDGTASYTGGQLWNSKDNTCYGNVTRNMGPVYTYGQRKLDVTGFVAGKTVGDPTKVAATNTAWDGCIEERATQSGTTNFTSASYDLDPELIPSNGTDTRWRPMWADVEYNRLLTGVSPDTTNGDDNNKHQNFGGVDRRQLGYYSCGKPVHRLSAMSNADIAAYVDASDFRPLGGTYHDTGMIWGTRLLSGSGIFAADNAGRAGQPVPRKVIVFLTDGDMSPNAALYGLYGVENFDKRVSNGDTGNLTNYHNARFLYECGRARQLGIDVWTVAIDTSSSDQLTQCARNSSQALYTTTGSGLSAIFQKIAKQVAMLRIDQ
ncbi:MULTISPECIES: TadE/TadG family type IV pilus assembly protein [unclassified Sphingomonas]|uniref:TadE/TadG family type IV pilus assembly protein n=1 Tax=unclassified Sphingomonas TaxID=196159 RepID=UPI00182651FC|nr:MULTISPECIES: TadE/TadG family type IV pilus assembly protein [unclassified Sphingomonas]MBB3346505.1 Flp pilus assembly protein TadG [Sphingomonas sp. BK069]MBB3473184.1 Flp pilus assembly protein TadG [Sphingomonas sp. BK345]